MVRFDFYKKKITKSKKKIEKKNRNRFKPTGFGSVWFGFLDKNRFKPVWLGLARFFWFGSVFSVWLGFFRFFRFGSVFPVPGLKNRNRTEPVGFFKILIGLIGFFLRFGFFGYFFSGFLGLIGFSVFLTPLIYIYIYITRRRKKKNKKKNLSPN